MKPIRLYDANSWIRRIIEADATGLPLRNLLNDVNVFDGLSIFVWDGRGGNDRRRKMFPEYKSGRKPPSDDIWATMDFYKQMLRLTSAFQITVDGYEGDDTIAAIAGRYGNETPVHILSTDRDLCALVHGNVTHEFSAKVGSEWVRLYKATKGDPSDSIPGIKGFGDKAWEEADKDELLEWYEEGCERLFDAETTIERFNVSKAVANWLVGNEDTAYLYWTIVGFFPPTDDEIEAGTVVGVRNDAEVDRILKEFML